MSNKSELRIKIEQAITDAGYSVGNMVFTDKSKSGWRIKFCLLHLEDSDIVNIRAKMREAFPNNDIRVWNVNPKWYRGYGGLAVKVFNN